jgi:hypothetical protein
MQGIARLRALLQNVPSLLATLSDSAAQGKSSPSAWSPKEELGHLIDYAANNHQRIVRAQLEDHPAMPGYDQAQWVALHGYQRREWSELIDLWRVLNRQLLAAAEAVPDSAWSRTCTVASSEPLTLKFIFEDYIDHMMHHLRHIGIDGDELKPEATSTR